jgi:hypothetical protein
VTVVIIVEVTYTSLQYRMELQGVKICFSHVAQNWRKLAAISGGCCCCCCCSRSGMVPIDDLALPLVGVEAADGGGLFDGTSRRDLLAPEYPIFLAGPGGEIGWG